MAGHTSSLCSPLPEAFGYYSTVLPLIPFPLTTIYPGKQEPPCGVAQENLGRGQSAIFNGCEYKIDLEKKEAFSFFFLWGRGPGDQTQGLLGKRCMTELNPQPQEAFF